MSCLSVYHQSTPDIPNKVLTHLEDIVATLAEQGVGFERRQVTTPIRPGAAREEVVEACQMSLDQLMTERGLVSVDVISLDDHHPDKAELWARDEHHHQSDEVRWFVAGRGLFSLHIGEYVYALLCEKNDLVSVPAGTARWFDMGEQPRVSAIRLFKHAQGAQEHFTGDDIASRFPPFDDCLV